MRFTAKALHFQLANAYGSHSEYKYSMYFVGLILCPATVQHKICFKSMDIHTRKCVTFVKLIK
jgi:hypothetical protein